MQAAKQGLIAMRNSFLVCYDICWKQIVENGG